LWRDKDGEWADRLSELDLPSITTLSVNGNEFGVKQRIFDAEPSGKFLIYLTGDQPDTWANWLLDVELAYGLFTADAASLVLLDLGGGDRYQGVVSHYPVFFKAAKRRQAWQAKVGPEDNDDQLTAKMVQVVVGADDHTLQSIWRQLLLDYAAGKTGAMDELSRCGLAGFHWDGTARIYGYTSAKPSVDDFVLWLFDLAWRQFLPGPEDGALAHAGTYRNVQIDFGHWRNDQLFQATFRLLADQAGDDLGIQAQAGRASLDDLLKRDVFRQVEQQIILCLITDVVAGTIHAADVEDIVRSRTPSVWFAQFEHLYRAVETGARLLWLIDGAIMTFTSPTDGFHCYHEQLFKVDQAYRQFIWHFSQAEASSPLEPLKVKVEAAYRTRYLDRLGTAWQQQIDTVDRWPIKGVPAQTGFFADRVTPVAERGNKLVVIISDGLRYEAADELCVRLRNIDRLDASIDAMVSVLPSYTQLGMAALLPHQNLLIKPGDKSGLVEVDGKPSNGTDSRTKLLQPSGGAAVQSTDFMALSRDEARDLVKASQIVYIYHNVIDDTGDKQISEPRVFQAVEDTITDLIKLVKKLTGAANVSNVVITADHGFLYQDSGLDPEGYLSEEPQADRIWLKKRRFAIGLDFKRDPAFTTFSSAQLGLAGDAEIQLPKGMQRLRAGSGSRYVHGGAALPEITVPVISVNKKRASDVRQVTVKLLPETDRITTAQITVNCYQVDQVTDKVKPIRLTAGLYAGETLISSEVTVEFSQTSTDKRDRYFPLRLILSTDADAYNGQVVELRLSEQIADTSHRRWYPEKARFTLAPVFARDFDF